ncbi:MAG: hypothetical protein OEY01_03880 [Desulfobulbaceae bacterium]|nr:hypothetical protein [Desulfobulbaceae bacterium]
MLNKLKWMENFYSTRTSEANERIEELVHKLYALKGFEPPEIYIVESPGALVDKSRYTWKLITQTLIPYDLNTSREHTIFDARFPIKNGIVARISYSRTRLLPTPLWWGSLDSGALDFYESQTQTDIEKEYFAFITSLAHLVGPCAFYEKQAILSHKPIHFPDFENNKDMYLLYKDGFMVFDDLFCKRNTPPSWYTILKKISHKPVNVQLEMCREILAEDEKLRFPENIEPFKQWIENPILWDYLKPRCTLENRYFYRLYKP